jgi:hypothetical protein
VFLQTAKPDQVNCFQSVTKKINESRAKLSGNFTNVQTGTMLFPQQNAAITSNRRMAVNVHIKAACQAAQALWGEKEMKIFAVTALLIGIGAVPALAQSYDFTYSDANYILSGVLTASPDGGGVYTVTGVTGTVAQTSAPSTTYALTLVPPGVVAENHNGDDLFGQDDLIYPGQTPLLTICPNWGCALGGLLFAFPAGGALSGYNGGSDIALFANNGSGNGSGDYGSIEYSNLGGYGNLASGGTFTLSAVPDGGTTLVLLGLAVAGLAGLRRKLSA